MTHGKYLFLHLLATDQVYVKIQFPKIVVLRLHKMS